MASNTTCPCGSGSELAQCCAPFIQHKKKPSTAEQLLRSRYTAFTQGEVDYILETHHPRTVSEVKRSEIEDWSKNSKWLGLKIVQQEAGKESDKQGVILFCAQYEAEGKANEHWEQAYFEKDGAEWRFLDAKGVHTGPYKREAPKIGRNDPCSCGSGQKFKKCHGKT